MLGYTYMGIIDLNDNLDVSTYDFKVQSESSGEAIGLSWISRHYYADVVQNHPDAKFIVPHSKRSEVVQSHLRRIGVRSKTAAHGD